MLNDLQSDPAVYPPLSNEDDARPSALRHLGTVPGRVVSVGDGLAIAVGDADEAAKRVVGIRRRRRRRDRQPYKQDQTNCQYSQHDLRTRFARIAYVQAQNGSK